MVLYQKSNHFSSMGIWKGIVRCLGWNHNTHQTNQIRSIKAGIIYSRFFFFLQICLFDVSSVVGTLVLAGCGFRHAKVKSCIHFSVPPFFARVPQISTTMPIKDTFRIILLKTSRRRLWSLFVEGIPIFIMYLHYTINILHYNIIVKLYCLDVECWYKWKKATVMLFLPS